MPANSFCAIPAHPAPGTTTCVAANIWSTSPNTAREQLSEYLERTGVKKEDSDGKREQFKIYAQKFATNYLRQKRKEFYQSHAETDEFYFYASVSELHNDFLNAFTWLQKAVSKPVKRTDNAVRTNFAPQIQPQKRERIEPNNDALQKIASLGAMFLAK